MIDLLRSVEMFQGLTTKQLTGLASAFQEQAAEIGEVLFREGDEADRLYLVISGFIEIVVRDPQTGEDHVVVHLGRGQSVGEMSLIDRGRRSATARVVAADTAVAWASFDALNDLLDRKPRTGYRIVHNIAADLSFRLRRQDQDARTAGQE